MHFLICQQKEKENSEQDWAHSSPNQPVTRKNARARARVGNFAQRPSAIWKTGKELVTLFLCFTDICA
jgi:hypothetical protein